MLLAKFPANQPVQDELAGDGVQMVLRSAIHAKALVIDGRLALVGSQNLTTAALDRNREEGVQLDNLPVVPLGVDSRDGWAIVRAPSGLVAVDERNCPRRGRPTGKAAASWWMAPPATCSWPTPA